RNLNRAFSIRLATWSKDQRALRSVRLSVFVEEQKVDAREEFDDADPVCQHILAIDASGKAIGTGRIDDKGKIGRLAVLPEWRKLGVGRAILQKAVDLAREDNLKRVYLHAQVSAMGFYEREGFTSYGECFIEAGIKHVAMERNF
ncbi:MAG TPA: GNAT family N-acetyltransferase, partial [Steroidobacteraceae bacterium]|nr:GNAT family N-acetyltransferase [Steroidobacteraceae bacterium]